MADWISIPAYPHDSLKGPKYNHSFQDCFSRTNKEVVSSPQYFSYGDILFAGTGELIEEIGKNIVYLGSNACLAGGDIIVVKHSQNPSFLNYAMSSYYAQYQKSLGKAKLKVVHITASQIGNIRIILPPLPEQKKIADFLDAKCANIDQIRADIEKQIEILTDYKKSIITEAVTKGLDPKAKMKDSGIEWIGKIPCNWNMTKIKYLLTDERDSLKVGPFGSQLSGSDIVDDGFWVYSQRTVLDKNFETNTMFISNEKFLSMVSFQVREKDILITTRGTIGKIARVPNDFHQGIIHPCVMKFRLNEDKFDYDFLEKIFNHSDILKDQLIFLSNATTIEVIYSGTLKNIVLPHPPLSEQKAIATYLDDKCLEIDATIAEKQKQLETLEEYKKSLIFEYVTGKKEVV